MVDDGFDATWEAAKAGEETPPPGLFDDDAPDPVPPPEVLAEVIPIRRGVAEPDTSSEMKPALTAAFNALDARVRRGPGLAGAACGISKLDDALDGWQCGRLYVLGGRTGMGKSIVGLNVAMGLARNGFGVDFLSLEMPTEEQAMRCLLCAARVPHWRVKRAQMAPEHWSAMTAEVGAMCKWPWVWDDRGGVGVEWIAQHASRTADRLKARGATLHAVVVDHVQKIKGANERAPRHEQMKWIVDGLKQLAKRDSLCVIALAQINRSTEARGTKDHRPRMADLREAGSVEEEADAVGLLYRDDYYAAEGGERTNVLEVALPKIRGGEPAHVKLRFDGARYRIDNLAADEDV
jgi:replicative DNA helicase